MENYNQNFSQFTIEDFATDESFQQWVLSTDVDAQNFWEKWLIEHPEKAQTIAEARKLVLLLGFANQKIDEERIRRVKANIDQKIQANNQPTKMRALPVNERRTNPYRKYYWLAASVLGLVFISLWWYQSYQPPQTVLYKTNFGESKKIILPDGSEVYLNANSTLTYLEATEGRMVNLDGDALFKVKKQLIDKDKEIYQSFTVKTNRLTIKVLGTEFNVKSRTRQTEVVLHSGKVQLSWQNAQKEANYIMKPGEQAIYNANQKQPQLNLLSSDKLEAWHQHRLVFDGATLQEVADEIKANFGIEIIFQDKDLSQKKFVGVIPNNNLSMLLNALSKLYGITVKKQGQQVILSKDKEIWNEDK
jgi:ferric-dicitrate binding protein FerR (iron transport regulator)